MRTMLLAAASAAALSFGTLASAQEKQTILETAAAAGNFNTLAAAVEAAGLTETLSGEGPSPSSRPRTRPWPPCPRARWTSCSPTPSSSLPS